MAPAESGGGLQAGAAACHGQCFGEEWRRDTWEAPRLVVRCDAEARPGYDSMDACEYQDEDAVLDAKVRFLADLVRRSKKCMVYSGAGLSTSAGIADYASAAPDTLAGAPGSNGFLSPLCAQPTQAHRVLVEMHRLGLITRWVNQNHDGLPQKAGLPQEAINEIHGAWHAPDNPVIMMGGELRSDLFEDLLACTAEADLTLALGSSMCGMNADRLVSEPAARAGRRVPGQLGAVIVGLQRTVHDGNATLRIFARCDDVFERLAKELEIVVPQALPKGKYFVPRSLVDLDEDAYVFTDLPYDAAGARQAGAAGSLDVREGAALVIPRGLHAGAVGEAAGFDREGNLRCRFLLRAKTGKLRAPVQMLIGRWWLQAAIDGAVPTLPAVNVPVGDSPSAAALRDLMDRYGR